MTLPQSVRRELRHLRASNTALRRELTTLDPDHSRWSDQKNRALDDLLVSISRLLAAFDE